MDVLAPGGAPNNGLNMNYQYHHALLRAKKRPMKKKVRKVFVRNRNKTVKNQAGVKVRSGENLAHEQTNMILCMQSAIKNRVAFPLLRKSRGTSMYRGTQKLPMGSSHGMRRFVFTVDVLYFLLLEDV